MLLLLACAQPDKPNPVQDTDTAEVDTAPPDTDTAADTAADPDSAVDTADTATVDTDTGTDADGDGVGASTDCDDSNADIYPGAFDQCDTIDQDCDGEPIGAGACSELTDFGVGTVWIVDHAGNYGLGGSMIGDVTGDGIPDLLAASLEVYTVFAGGTRPAAPWTQPTDGWHSIVDLRPEYTPLGKRLAVGDADGDGLEDIGVLTDYRFWGVQIYTGPFAGGATTSASVDHVYADPGEPTWSDAMWGSADIEGGLNLDGDGRDDLIATNDDFSDPTYTAFFGGEWDPCTLGDFYGGGITPLGDLDGDGLDDVLLTGSPTGVMRGADLRAACGGALTDVAFLTAPEDDDWSGIANVGDWNGDGWPDLAIGRDDADTAGEDAGELSFYTGPYAGELGPEAAIGSWTGPAPDAGLGSGVRPLDLDGDGTVEVLTGMYTETSSRDYVVFRGGTVPGPHEPAPERYLRLDPTTWTAFYWTVGDLDADGHDDVFIEADDRSRTGIFPGFDVPWDDPTYW